MKTQQLDLERRLEREGWRVIERQSSPHWWAAEIWTIESTWRPAGRLLWMTFLVDPQYDGLDDAEHVWAVGATATPPSDRH
jgi:hypothetical protein